MESTGIHWSFRLQNKPKQNYGLFSKLSIAVTVAFDVDKHPHMYPTRENQNIQEINRQFYGTLNYFGDVVFSENQENN